MACGGVPAEVVLAISTFCSSFRFSAASRVLAVAADGPSTAASGGEDWAVWLTDSDLGGVRGCRGGKGGGPGFGGSAAFAPPLALEACGPAPRNDG